MFRSLTIIRLRNFTSKNKKQSTIWMNEHTSDPYVRKAQLLNYRSRAAFKLIEIQHRYNILKPGYKVLDLGCAPGSWTQVVVEIVKSTDQKPTVLGVDLLDCNKMPGAQFIKGDIEDHETRIKMQQFFDLKQVDTIVCDAAPNFTGDKDCDHMGISVLNELCMVISKNMLKTGGNLLMKTLQGTLENESFKSYKHYFKNFQRIKPNSSRQRSSELYYLGRGYKLSENYMKLQKIQELIKSNKSLNQFSQSELMELKLDNDSLTEMLQSQYQMAHSVDDKETLVKIKQLSKQLKLDINFEDIALPQKLQNDDQILEELQKQLSGKFSFSKKIPKTVDELDLVLEKRNEIRAAKLKNKNKDEGLLEEDDEYIQFENDVDPENQEFIGLSDSDLENTIKQFEEIMKDQIVDDEFQDEEDDEEEYSLEKYKYERTIHKQEQEEFLRQMGMQEKFIQAEMNQQGYDQSKYEDQLKNMNFSEEEKMQYNQEFDDINVKAMKRINEKRQRTKNLKESRASKFNNDD